MQVPQALEDAAWEAARAELGEGALAGLAAAVIDRSRRYTSEREHLAAPSDPVGDLAARATFFTVADAMKVAVPLGELAGRGAIPARQPLRVVDLGAGCGAMTLGALATLAPEISLDVLAIDRDERALRICARAVRAFGGSRVSIATRRGDAAAAPADLVLLGSVLNELADGLPLVERALAQVADDGAVVIVEPALRDTSRALHAIRDAMIGRGAHVFAPCTRAIAPCPALADPRDWCHEDRAVALPARTRQLASRTHLRDGGLRFAYLVLRKTPLRLVDVPAWRLVSAPMPAKGKLEILGCSDAGRMPIRRLRRHRSEANHAFERARRGDVLAVDAQPADGRLDLSGDTAVRQCRLIAGSESG